MEQKGLFGAAVLRDASPKKPVVEIVDKEEDVVVQERTMTYTIEKVVEAMKPEPKKEPVAIPGKKQPN